MKQDKRHLIIKIRNYLHSQRATKINLLEICQNINCELNEITKWAPTPEALIEQILDFKSQELTDVLDSERYNSESAIDSMVISGQEIYERFEQLSPANYVFIADINPALYKNCQAQKFKLIKNHLSNNLDKGQATGEYKQNIDKKLIVDKYINRIKDLHTSQFLKSEHFTFANVFSNIFEDYLEEVATEENWNYFRKRKQFYEAISFINR
jgi:MoaA/NifB/PqqE/SkfB family radical SAM enzyme